MSRATTVFLAILGSSVVFWAGFLSQWQVGTMLVVLLVILLVTAVLAIGASRH